MGVSELDKDTLQSTLSRVKFVNGTPYISLQLQEKEVLVLPEQIASLILGKMKKTAEDRLGKTVKKVVITVPARFNQAQRMAMITAAKIAGTTR